MEIQKYVLELLKEHDCVIIPEFGGFIANSKHSQLQLEAFATITPPRKTILFNSHLNLDDGLLINNVAKDLNLTYKDAKQKVKEYVSEFNDLLKKEKYLLFEGLGSFKFNKSNKLQFEPIVEESFDPDSFGLANLQVPLFEQETGRKITVEQKAMPSYKVLLSKKALQRALYIAPFAIAVALIPTNFYNKLQESALVSIDSANSTVLANQKAEAEAEKINLEVIDTNQRIVKQLEKETSKEFALQYDEHANNYHLIIGSFKEENNAQLFIQAQTHKELSCRIITKGGYFRVSIGSYAYKKDAVNALLDVKAKTSIKDAWVYKAEL